VDQEPNTVQSIRITSGSIRQSPPANAEAVAAGRRDGVLAGAFLEFVLGSLPDEGLAQRTLQPTFIHVAREAVDAGNESRCFS